MSAGANVQVQGCTDHWTYPTSFMMQIKKNSFQGRKQLGNSVRHSKLGPLPGGVTSPKQSVQITGYNRCCQLNVTRAMKDDKKVWGPF